MAITLVLEPDDQERDEPERVSQELDLHLLRSATSGGLPAVLIVTDEGRVGTLVSLRELLAAGRGLRAKAETWPEWQAADTP